MPLTDYAETLERLQKALAAQHAKAPQILNTPGVSVALKLDQNYWLVLDPLFVTSLAKWSGLLPDTVLQTLTRTGNMITAPAASGEGKDAVRSHALPLAVTWPSQPGGLELSAAFVLADFIERALSLYGETEAARAASHSLSDLRIRASERDKVQAFFSGKTPPGKWAYDVPA